MATVTIITAVVLSFVVIYACLVAAKNAQRDGEVNGIVGRRDE